MKSVTYRNQLLVMSALLTAPFAHAATSVSFVDNVGGYTGATDIYIPRATAIGGAPATATATDSIFVDQLFIDHDSAGGTTYGAVIYQFADVFGAGAGQVDLGYEIVSASLRLQSGTSGSADTTSDPRVYGITGPTSVSTTYEDLSGFNPTQQGADTNSYIYSSGSSLITPWQSFVDSHGDDVAVNYDVSQYIRSVSAGSVAPENLALLATNTSTNGWQLATSISADASRRPTLEITYDASRVQNSVVLGSGQAIIAELGNQGDDVTTPKTSGGIGIDYALDQEADPALPDEIIDPTGALEQHLEQGLIKFDLAGVLPGNAVLQQARLVTPTATVSNAQSGDTNNSDGGITVRQVLVDWDLEANATLPTLPSEFGSEFGIQVSEGEADAAFVDLSGNFLDGSSVGNAGFDSLSQGEEAVFDVTDIVQAWLDGEENYGFVISKIDEDGWQFEASGVELQLDFTTPVPEPGSLALLGLGAVLISARRRR